MGIASEHNAQSVLVGTQVTVMLPVVDMARARNFYEQQLGLQAGQLKPDGKFVFHCAGTELALFPKPGGTKADHTAVSFRVDDIVTAIRALTARGVAFARL